MNYDQYSPSRPMGLDQFSVTLWVIWFLEHRWKWICCAQPPHSVQPHFFLSTRLQWHISQVIEIRIWNAALFSFLFFFSRFSSFFLQRIFRKEFEKLPLEHPFHAPAPLWFNQSRWNWENPKFQNLPTETQFHQIPIFYQFFDQTNENFTKSLKNNLLQIGFQIRKEGSIWEPFFAKASLSLIWRQSLKERYVDVRVIILLGGKNYPSKLIYTAATAESHKSGAGK